ncbi:hypothetical protein V3C99_008707 [Haemonchus contortus]
MEVFHATILALAFLTAAVHAQRKRSHAHPHPEHVNDLLNYLEELGRLDKSLTRLAEHAKDKQAVGRIRENLRRYFDREFEKMRSFNEQFYRQYSNNEEGRVRTFVGNFRDLLQRVRSNANPRSKRFSDREFSKRRENLQRGSSKKDGERRDNHQLAAEISPVEVVHST